MSEIDVWKILLVLISLSFFYGIINIRNSTRKIATSRIITIMLIGYSILTIAFVSLIYATFFHGESSTSNIMEDK